MFLHFEELKQDLNFSMFRGNPLDMDALVSIASSCFLMASCVISGNSKPSRKLNFVISDIDYPPPLSIKNISPNTLLTSFLPLFTALLEYPRLLPRNLSHSDKDFS